MSKRKPKQAPPGSRAARRSQDREQGKLARDLEQLWQHEPGASAERAIAISSAAEVEVRARATPCPICRGELKLQEHRAETAGGRRVRVAAMVCAICGAPRSIYFQLPGATLN